jgi:hypothetical protein
MEEAYKRHQPTAGEKELVKILHGLDKLRPLIYTRDRVRSTLPKGKKGG